MMGREANGAILIAEVNCKCEHLSAPERRSGHSLMSKTIHLYTKGSHLTEVTGTVGLLCEFAPDTPWLRGAEHCYCADEMLGSPDAALQISYSVVSKLLRGAPVVEGLPLLSIFEEELIEQTSYIVQAFHLDHWISSQGFTLCHFTAYSPWLDRLRQVRAISGSSFELITDLPLLQSTHRGRLLSKLWDSLSTPREIFRRVAPLWSRYLSGLPKRKVARNTEKGGIWFYSTAYNYTKIALEYEAYLPGKLNFLVEDPSTGGKRLRELARDWRLLHAWSRRSDIPSASQARAVGNLITSAIGAVTLSPEESALRTVLLGSDWYHHLLSRQLPFAIYNSRVVRRFRECVAPDMILVGNAAWERALLMRDDATRAPTVMLQHGVMHWVYAVADQPVDVLVLRGPFFQRVIEEELRRKTVIRNFPAPAVSGAQSAGTTRDHVLFITAPYDVLPLFHLQDLRDILSSLLRVAETSRRPLIIRVHPMEKISWYERTIAELQKELGMHPAVVYSQGPGADDVLARSCVAVLYFSTMFLDCLRHGIPIVSFGWHWFPYMRQFEAEQILNFASDLRSFEALVEQGIEGKLTFRRAGLDQFMAQTKPEEISSLFKAIWDSRTSRKEAASFPGKP